MRWFVADEAPALITVDGSVDREGLAASATCESSLISRSGAVEELTGRRRSRLN